MPRWFWLTAALSPPQRMLASGRQGRSVKEPMEWIETLDGGKPAPARGNGLFRALERPFAAASLAKVAPESSEGMFAGHGMRAGLFLDGVFGSGFQFSPRPAQPLDPRRILRAELFFQLLS